MIHKVLLIDEDPATSLPLITALRRWGYVAEMVDTRCNAITKIASEPVQLVLISTTLSNPDGYSLCRSIRQMYSADQLAVILLTPATNDDVRGKVASAGADDFIQKPVLLSELIRIVQYHSQGHLPNGKSGQ